LNGQIDKSLIGLFGSYGFFGFSSFFGQFYLSDGRDTLMNVIPVDGINSLREWNVMLRIGSAAFPSSAVALLRRTGAPSTSSGLRRAKEPPAGTFFCGRAGPKNMVEPPFHPP